jgi:hypothetical protein
MVFSALFSHPETFGEQRRVQIEPDKLKTLRCFSGDLLIVKSKKSGKVSVEGVHLTVVIN